jgi:cellulose 1,4-beta-cellobiosidase
MFVIYDLPNRDCAALASNGEILCEDATCAQGLNTYKTQYVDKVVAILAKYSDVKTVVIIEPDSLPNLATNLGVPKCSQA